MERQYGFMGGDEDEHDDVVTRHRQFERQSKFKEGDQVIWAVGNDMRHGTLLTDAGAMVGSLNGTVLIAMERHADQERYVVLRHIKTLYRLGVDYMSAPYGASPV